MFFCSPLLVMSTIDLLTKVSLFKTLSPADLQRLADHTEPASFSAGESVVEIGDPGRSLYVLVEGIVQVLYPARTSDFELARLGPGDFFGEMALLSDRPRSATVRAHSDVRAIKLEKHVFQRLLLEEPQIGLGILEVLSLRIRAADEQIGGLSDQAQRDPLTRLQNRRAFNERIGEECDRFLRYGAPFSIVLMDVDRMQDVNDTFGLEVGDTTIGWIGRLLIEHTRGVDVAFRVGGEEFAVLCPSIGVDHARSLGQRVVDLVSEARPPVSFDLKVTMSAGVAGCPADGRRPDDLYTVADQALLKAKREGRNRVCASAELVM
jgi:diguanylate cyclase (GGDEF)-like protein